MRTYRTSIRINGQKIDSPRFSRKADAVEWYFQMRRQKQFMRDGLVPKSNDDGMPFIEFAGQWIRNRMANYPAATWKSDEQRLRDYILPIISELPINKIGVIHIKGLLRKITEPGFKAEGVTISASTRERVKALLSAIFSDALNEEPPLIQFNPVHGIKFKEKRMGKKAPRSLGDSDAVIHFVKAAKELSALHYAVACTFLMSGLRKQELIALKWSSIDFKSCLITVSEKYEQASNSIKPGSKAGEDATREIPVSQDLIDVLTLHKKTQSKPKDSDFVFSKEDGSFLGPKYIWDLINSIATKADVSISPHGLRHTFGREFAENSGNMKALQAIMGHSSSATTDLYSNLRGKRLKRFSEVVTLKGVKESVE